MGEVVGIGIVLVLSLVLGISGVRNLTEEYAAVDIQQGFFGRRKVYLVGISKLLFGVSKIAAALLVALAITVVFLIETPLTDMICTGIMVMGFLISIFVTILLIVFGKERLL